MKVGILRLGSVEPSTLSYTGEDIDQAFTRWLHVADDTVETITHVPPRGDLPPNPLACDGWILSGSRSRIVDPPEWQEPFEEWIRNAIAKGAKIFGTCYGHQSVARALDGNVAANEHLLQVGPRTMDLNSAGQQCFAGKTQLTIMQSHNDIVSKVPTGFISLATNELCEIEAMALGNQVLTFQGHPEFSDKMIQNDLNNSKTQVPANQYEAACKRYESIPLDNGYLSKFVVGMFKKQESMM